MSAGRGSLVPPTSGNIEVDGRQIDETGPDRGMAFQEKDLSGGMRQRVAIARFLALDSPIMLMDEPFGALDALTRRNLQDELLRIWADFRKTIIFVTHSIEESIYLADRVVVMTYRPGTIKRDQRIAIPRSRDPASPEFNDLKKELGQLVMEEQERHHLDEMKVAAVD